jgi:hypothetical protein
MQVFNNLFADKASICEEYELDDFDGVVIFADYEYENYSGDACVIFANEGKLWMVSDSHCSCYGLDGGNGPSAWQPEEITVEQLRHMASSGWGKDLAAAQSVLQIIEKFGHIEDPDALAAAVTLYFAR